MTPATAVVFGPGIIEVNRVVGWEALFGVSAILRLATVWAKVVTVLVYLTSTIDVKATISVVVVSVIALVPVVSNSVAVPVTVVTRSVVVISSSADTVVDTISVVVPVAMVIVATVALIDTVDGVAVEVVVTVEVQPARGKCAEQ